MSERNVGGSNIVQTQQNLKTSFVVTLEVEKGKDCVDITTDVSREEFLADALLFDVE